MNKLTHDIKALLIRDLNKLVSEISLYKSEENLWVIGKKINNSAGNLALHLCGNLKHFIGAVLGSSDYRRNRDYEFSARNIDRDIVLKEINETIITVDSVLENLTDNELLELYPDDVLGYKMSKQYFLIHLHGHLNYHLGQVNYHRRLLD